MNQEKGRALLVAGARPNFMKVAALLPALESTGAWRTFLIHTGQHYDAEMSQLFFDQLGLPRPDVNLGIGSDSQASQTARIMLALEKVASELQPDLVVVVGDVNSTLAGALVAAKLQVPVAHVEAGLRSFDRSMPEEINRLLADAVSDYLFATEPAAVDNLQREGIPAERIFLVGNVMIDTLRRFLPVAERSRIHETLELPLPTGSSSNSYAVVTLHRPSNVDEEAQLSALVDLFEQIAATIPIVFPVHPRTRLHLQRLGLPGRTQKSDTRLRLLPPLGYLDFLALLQKATFVLTDSGGIQEETTVLGVPCLTLRRNTERPITVSDGTNQVVGTDLERIQQAVDNILSGESKRGQVPKLWDGKAAERIAAVVTEKFQ